MTGFIKQIPITCSGHTRPITDLKFSSLFLISACKDGKPMLRNAETGDWVGTFEGHKGAVFGVSINSTSKLSASGAADFTAKVWDTETGNEKWSFEHEHVVKSVALSNDSNCLLTGSNEHLLKVYDLSKGSLVETYRGHCGNIKSAFFCHEDKCVISCAEKDKKVRLWDRNSSKEIFTIEFETCPSNIDISDDGKILIAIYSSFVVFYELDKMKKIKEIETPCKLETASLHPDKLFFVCGGEDFKIYKFDYATGQEIENYKGHFGPIHCISFSKDGELYASGSEDGTLRLWQTTVGKTYGLWKNLNGDEKNLMI